MFRGVFVFSCRARQPNSLVSGFRFLLLRLSPSPLWFQTGTGISSNHSLLFPFFPPTNQASTDQNLANSVRSLYHTTAFLPGVKRYAGCLRRFWAIVDKGPSSTVASFLAIPGQDYFVVLDFDSSHILVVHRSMCGVEERPQWLERKTCFVRSSLLGVQRVFIPALHN